MVKLGSLCCVYLCLLCMDLVELASVHLRAELNKQIQNDQGLSVLVEQPHRHRHHHGSQTQTCASGEFLHRLENGQARCTTCSTCPAGFGVKRRCDLTSDTVCERCTPGFTYRREYFGVPKCFRCRKCDNSILVKECTATSNRVCGGCKPGYFRDDMTGTCIRCSYCYPEIPNYGIVEPMCQSESQPPEMTCLPSLPPRELRESTTVKPQVDVTVSATLTNRVQSLDAKLQRLGSMMTEELQEVRQELHSLKTVLKDVNV